MLSRIADSVRLGTERKKASLPPGVLKKEAELRRRGPGFPFENALRRSGISFICEVKKASPSKGLIAADFPYIDIAKEYERAGASAISVLTEPEFFSGRDAYLSEISKEVSVPLLRKDFILDDYQIYESLLLGASAVLLICSLLDTDTIRGFISLCDGLGLSALVEAHNESEIESALRAGARIIGVNNRDLNDFTVDIRNSITLRKYVPADIIFVAESGMRTPHDIELLKHAGIDAVLIGETLMRCKDKAKKLRELMGDIN